MNIAIISHPSRPEAGDVEHTVVAEAQRLGVAVTEPSEADVVISIGGDGTLLRAVRTVDFAKPVVGIDVGHVGYLAEVEPKDAVTLVGALASGDYRVVERMTIAVEVTGQEPQLGLNDVVIEKVLSQHAVRLLCRIDGEALVTYRADGVIVASPTGSTAYAYSAGGPVVDPRVSGLVVVPVAPHNLFGRALVLDPSSVIDFEVLAGRPVRVNIDGLDCGEVASGGVVTVRRGSPSAQMVTLADDGFASRVVGNLGVS